MKGGKLVFTALTLLALSTVFVAPVAADHETEEEQQTGILAELTEAISEFTENWEENLEDLLHSILFEPFINLVGALLSLIARLLTATPDVHPNPAVEEVHTDVLLVTFLLSSLAFIVAGILHMIGPILGISYGQVRKILPRVIIALVFSAVSLPLLQLGVDFTRALTIAFQPDFLDTTIQQNWGITTGLVLAYIFQSLLLLAVAVLFIIRDVYILFVAAISPLLALGWSLPRVKRYSDTFIAGWFAALLIAPLDMLVLKFSFALTSGAGSTVLQGVSNWLLGVASLVLLLLVPKQVWDASQAAVGLTYAASSSVKQRINSSPENQDSLLNEEQKNRLRERRRKRRASSSKSFSYDWGDD
ncbi:hypothetical protein [Halobellus clavatus]|uniref:TrbL/VirB6 plasmid conjugal transfer protein n=1 Tax=Halobellus clavatus TaxID=660517 RepID=A0A1H3DH80_9EURY|nr:hypothetical protein [Halobellus clavatus]SDX65717.1 hypothetical protein SAMN04487946_101573 [Halobellus clavatus]